MKIRFLFILFGIATFLSCQPTQNEPSELNKLGFVGNDGGAFLTGDQESIDIWLRFCELHSSKSIEEMLNLCSESIYVELTDGETIEGKDNFREGLINWMSDSEISISQDWGAPLTFVNRVDSIDKGTWVVTGHNLIVKSGNNVHTEDNHVNVYINNGLIQYMKVYTHKITDVEAVEVSFSVDMSTYEEDYTTVGVFGTFNDWCGSCNQLKDEDGDLVFTGTVTIPIGSFEYKFILDNQLVEESFEPGTFCTNTTDTYTNRQTTISDITSLPTVCFNSCNSCD